MMELQQAYLTLQQELAKTPDGQKPENLAKIQRNIGEAVLYAATQPTEG